MLGQVRSVVGCDSLCWAWRLVRLAARQIPAAVAAPDLNPVENVWAYIEHQFSFGKLQFCMSISNSLWEENNTITGIFMKSFRENGCRDLHLSRYLIKQQGVE